MRIVTDQNFKFEFCTGNFDDYCVDVTYPTGKKSHWLKDEEYFFWLKRLSKKYGVQRVYSTFLKVYDKVSVNTDKDTVNTLIRTVDKEYRESTQQLWSILYMTMLAEEYKEGTILGKRIKHLGVYNILFDNYGVSYTTRYMRGMNWRDLDKLMQQRGI